MNMHIKQNVNLSHYTSFGVGGIAENFVLAHDSKELLNILQNNQLTPIWVFGYGSNSLISDAGLPGLTIVNRGGEIQFNGIEAVVDAGVWWDDLVKSAIEHGFWGVECMSEVPGSVGAAIFINITAYGQSIGPLVQWAEVWDQSTQQIRKFHANDLVWGYKNSVFQHELKDCIILRACLRFYPERNDVLSYQKALDVAEELNLDPNKLEDRRKIIIEARSRTGSLWHSKDRETHHTVGSFFRNPIVTEDQAKKIMSFDESGKSSKELQQMNLVHGGNSNRVSAAHVMLASGFSRGQQWNKVKLNDQNLLKLEALPGATAQEIYNVAMEIQSTCEEKLGVQLEPEARILGDFGE